MGVFITRMRGYINTFTLTKSALTLRPVFAMNSFMLLIIISVYGGRINTFTLTKSALTLRPVFAMNVFMLGGTVVV